MTLFQVGQRVRSNVDAQRLRKGSEYTVARVEEYPTAFGNFVTYYVTDGVSPTSIAVGNGHLVLSPAPVTCEVCAREIPARDVRAFQAEAGSKTALPACCEDCAERS